MKSCLDKSGIAIDDVKDSYSPNNEKMEAIIQRFYKLYGVQFLKTSMPMSIHELGNSVATVPTLFDLLIRGEIKDQSIEKGDILLCFGREQE
jgi:3-oxoacyl-[acyl-carrier-protein] synthase-3